MASDLTIELFARDMFARFWYQARVNKERGFDVLEEELGIARKYIDVSDELFGKVIFYRYLIFEKFYSKDFTDEKISSLESLLDCFEYVIYSCEREDLFGNLTLFEKMFATLTFVIMLCYFMHYYGANDIDVLNYGPLFWAMYFDKFTDEFYEKGGWDQLNREIKPYKFLFEFGKIFDYHPFLHLECLKEAIVNYRLFKDSVDYHERKQKHPIHISNAWIKFRIGYSENYINIPLHYESDFKPNEVELLIEDLKQLLNPTTCNSSSLEVSMEKNRTSPFSTEMSYSEIPCISEEMKSNENDKQFQHLSFENKRIIDKVSDGFSHICTDFKKVCENSCSTSAVEELPLDVIDAKENLDLKQNTFTEIEQPKKGTVDTENSDIGHSPLLVVDMKRQPKTSINELPNISNIDLDLDHVNKTESHINKKDNSNEYCYKGSVEKEDEIANTNQVSIYQMETNKYSINSSTKDPENSILFDFKKESVSNGNETENREDVIKISLCSKTRDIEISKSTDDSSSSQMAALEENRKTTPEHIGIAKSTYDLSSSQNAFGWNGKTILDNMLTMKDFVSATEDERRKISKVRDDLTKEKNDNEVRKFLLMLLVLGDTKGTKFVLSTLQNSKDESGNAQENTNKKKKKKKRKTRN